MYLYIHRTLQARKYFRSSGDQREESYDKVMNSWIRLRQRVNPCRGQGQNIFAEAATKSPADAAMEVNAVSNFAELETRLVDRVAFKFASLFCTVLLMKIQQYICTFV